MLPVTPRMMCLPAALTEAPLSRYSLGASSSRTR